MVRAEQVTEPVAYHGEGPVWSDRWGGLRWVDMLAGDVLSLGPDGRVDRRHVGLGGWCQTPKKLRWAAHNAWSEACQDTDFEKNTSHLESRRQSGLVAVAVR